MLSILHHLKNNYEKLRSHWFFETKLSLEWISRCSLCYFRSNYKTREAFELKLGILMFKNKIHSKADYALARRGFVCIPYWLEISDFSSSATPTLMTVTNDKTSNYFISLHIFQYRLSLFVCQVSYLIYCFIYTLMWINHSITIF